MKPPRYDKILLSGSNEDLNEYIDESGKCLVVDWRGDEADLIDSLGEILPAGRLFQNWVDAEDDLYVIYRGIRHKVGLTMSGRDRYIALRRLNEIMVGEYELRVFRHTMEDDTHCFYPKSCAWWSRMEQAFPAEIQRVFARITPGMDFPDYRIPDSNPNRDE
jgi:hypothetical protein